MNGIKGNEWNSSFLNQVFIIRDTFVWISFTMTFSFSIVWKLTISYRLRTNFRISLFKIWLYPEYLMTACPMIRFFLDWSCAIFRWLKFVVITNPIITYVVTIKLSQLKIAQQWSKNERTLVINTALPRNDLLCPLNWGT